VKRRREAEDLFWEPPEADDRPKSSSVAIDLTEPGHSQAGPADVPARLAWKRPSPAAAIVRDSRHVATPTVVDSVVNRPLQQRQLPSSFHIPGQAPSLPAANASSSDTPAPSSASVATLQPSSSAIVDILDSQPDGDQSAAVPSTGRPRDRARRVSMGSDFEIARFLQMEEDSEIVDASDPWLGGGGSSSSVSSSVRAFLARRVPVPSPSARESPISRALSAAVAHQGALASALGLSAAENLDSHPPGQWLYAVEQNSRPKVCHGCCERISPGQISVLYRRGVDRGVHAAHGGCLSSIRGLRPSDQVHVAAGVSNSQRAAILSEISRLGSSSGEVRQVFLAPPRGRGSRGRGAARPARGRGDLHTRLHMMDRDFTAEDYEMLLQLDEESVQSRRGSLAEAEAQSLLEMLPVSTVAPSSAGAQCMVCLEPMDAGEQVRTLPCMHVFHRDCIDRWLSEPGRLPRCPIDQAKVELSAS